MEYEFAKEGADYIWSMSLLRMVLTIYGVCCYREEVEISSISSSAMTKELDIFKA